MKCLITLPDVALAHRLGWKLEEAGIVSTVTVDRTGFSTAAQVWIAEGEQELAAREVISTVVPVTMQRDVRCPMCKYDLRGHVGRTNCPECGAAVQAGEVPAVECVHCKHVFHSTVMNATCPKCLRAAGEKVGDVFCPKCGEVVPANFEACWQCGMSLVAGGSAADQLDVQIRLTSAADLAAILAISNHYALTTPANFAVEPEAIESWQRSFDETSAKYPWLVALSPPPQPGGGIGRGQVQSRSSEALSTEEPSPRRVAAESRPSPRGRGSEMPSPPTPLPKGEGLLIGFAKASPWKGRCAYAFAAETTVYISPDHHGRGVGRQLYAALLDIMRRQGFHMALGGITLPNDASVRLHESLGFKQVAEFPRIGWKFDRWHNVGYWAAELQDAEVAPRAIRPVAEVVGEVLE